MNNFCIVCKKEPYYGCLVKKCLDCLPCSDCKYEKRCQALQEISGILNDLTSEELKVFDEAIRRKGDKKRGVYPKRIVVSAKTKKER